MKTTHLTNTSNTHCTTTHSRFAPYWNLKYFCTYQRGGKVIPASCSRVKNLVTNPLTLSTTYATIRSQHIGMQIYGTNECWTQESKSPLPTPHHYLHAVFDTMALVWGKSKYGDLNDLNHLHDQELQ